MRRLIQDIADLRMGRYAKPQKTGEVLYVQARHFAKDGVFDGSVKSFIGSEEAQEGGLLNDKDILFASKGSRNLAAVYERSNGPAVASTSFIVVSIKSQYRQLIIPEFVAWFLNQPQARHSMRPVKGGTFIPSITIKGFRHLYIEIPSLEIQTLILKVDELKKQEHRLQVELETAKERLLQIQLFSSIH